MPTGQVNGTGPNTPVPPVAPAASGSQFRFVGRSVSAPVVSRMLETVSLRYLAVKSRSALLAMVMTTIENAATAAMRRCLEVALERAGPRLEYADGLGCRALSALEELVQRLPAASSQPEAMATGAAAGAQQNSRDETERRRVTTAAVAPRLSPNPFDVLQAVTHMLSVFSDRVFSSVNSSLDQASGRQSAAATQRSLLSPSLAAVDPLNLHVALYSSIESLYDSWLTQTGPPSQSSSGDAPDSAYTDDSFEAEV
ncbi:hypothetical protein V5799_004456 [Amblyomma americanum]|uniref:Uncharacterized protein n=1 Tax=Amblyomma americanum TaxID=6943 RepID=A0AAQ4D623_AMBAM